MTDLREIFVANLPAGHWHSMVLIALLKRLLLTETNTETRLSYLEHIDKMADLSLTRAMISAIREMENPEFEMWIELVKLDRGHSDCRNSSQFLMNWDGFASFVQANPSYVEAMRVKERQRLRDARLLPSPEATNRPQEFLHGDPGPLPPAMPAPLAAHGMRTQVATPGFRPW
jgi:hypothetical protein